ncbi:unnamed protein product [Fraxinus pennsylvanica]|uniref:Uncharacterized protein n=1 Tax=Fraxinus pennsylvanica TaxID=56036 RepID=A0AAD1Z7M0_9LAMI|nr:unnamed protein product [Fraxinus pennsylvanica]
MIHQAVSCIIHIQMLNINRMQLLTTNLRSRSIASDSLPHLQLPGDKSAHMTTTSSPGFLVSNNAGDMRSGHHLHLNVVNISSNFLSSRISERNSFEARKDSRRLFWDALSRRRDSPTMVFATGHAGELGSHDRWLLDIGRIHNDEVGHDMDSLKARHRRRNESRWLMRSEVLDEIQRQSPSLSPSMLSLPAPESVVDAFSLEYYKKLKATESDTSDVQQ